MNFKKIKRKFFAGLFKKIQFNEVGKIFLKKNELISFVTEDNSEHEVIRKDWGFYATQSVNSRLKKNYKTAKTENTQQKFFIMLVEKKFINKFKKYCKEEKQKVMCWLDEL